MSSNAVYLLITTITKQTNKNWIPFSSNLSGWNSSGFDQCWETWCNALMGNTISAPLGIRYPPTISSEIGVRAVMYAGGWSRRDSLVTFSRYLSELFDCIPCQLIAFMEYSVYFSSHFFLDDGILCQFIESPGKSHTSGLMASQHESKHLKEISHDKTHPCCFLDNLLLNQMQVTSSWPGPREGRC